MAVIYLGSPDSIRLSATQFEDPSFFAVFSLIFEHYFLEPLQWIWFSELTQVTTKLVSGSHDFNILPCTAWNKRHIAVNNKCE